MLFDTAVRNAKPKDKPYKLADSGGLYIEVLPAGGKYWRVKYRLHVKENRVALGIYPDITLADARTARDAAKKQIAEGLNPAHEQKRLKLKAAIEQEHSFKAIADDWLENRRESWSEKYYKQNVNTLDNDILPYLGQRPITKITAAELLTVIRRIESRDALDLSHKAKQICGRIFRYAIAASRAEDDPSPKLNGALKTRPVQNMARISEAEVPELLYKIHTYANNSGANGALQTELAVRLLLLTFVCTTEFRFAQWSEIDFEKQEWRIPAEKMKMGIQHIVPLSKQSISVLQKLKELTGKYRWLFPNVKSSQRTMSENTVLFALYRMGYHGRMTGHGFRGLASTILNENGFNKDWVERQLAHTEEDEVRAAYNHAQYLPQRRKMMQWWGDYLDRRMAENPPVVGNPAIKAA